MILGPKLVDWACSLRKTKKRFQRDKLVHSMLFDTRLCDESRAATEWCEAIQNMSLGPKLVDWACSLRKTKKRFERQKLMHSMLFDARLCNEKHVAIELCETIPNMSFGPKLVDRACSLRKIKKWFQRNKLVRSTLFDTGLCNEQRAAPKWCETTPNMSLGQKLVDRACSLWKTEKPL